jgi:hypothetical protein
LNLPLGSPVTLPGLPSALRRQLEAVPPSVDSGLAYRPCTVALRDGSFRDFVYVQEVGAWASRWIGKGLIPERRMTVDEVTSVAESRRRLPIAIANQLYDVGETGMGYYVFTLVFDDGREVPCLTGGAVDFIDLPDELDPARVVDVRVGVPTIELSKYANAADYLWCFYSSDPHRVYRPIDASRT